MPRRRTIACDDCGHLVRKRDEICELCGADTPQAKRRFRAQVIGFLLTAAIIAGGWFLLIKPSILAIGH